MESEKKYSPEEIREIVDKELRKANLKLNKELNLDEMDHVAGGAVIPSTHEEIDANWDLVASMEKAYGTRTAAIFARSLGLISSESNLLDFSVSELRECMHRVLNGEKPTLSL